MIKFQVKTVTNEIHTIEADVAEYVKDAEGKVVLIFKDVEGKVVAAFHSFHWFKKV